MKYNSIYTLLLIWMFTACSEPRVNVTAFPEHKQLLVDTVPINEIFLADFVTKSNNYFIIASSVSDTTLFFYEIPSLKFKSVAGIKGKGPNEIQTFPMFCNTLDDEYLYIKGYSPLLIKKTKLEHNGRLSFIDDYELNKNEEYNFMNIVKDSLLIYYNSNRLAITKYDLKNHVELDKIKMKKDDHGESYYYSNRGFIAANDSFVVYPYLYKKQIDIYTVDNFKLVKRICDGKKYSKIMLSDDKNITYHYFNVYAGKKYFYALYVGHKENDDFFNRSLEVYDYKGNPIIKYTFDIIPFYFVVDEERGYIYATNSNYEDYLLRYKL